MSSANTDLSKVLVSENTQVDVDSLLVGSDSEKQPSLFKGELSIYGSPDSSTSVAEFEIITGEFEQDSFQARVKTTSQNFVLMSLWLWRKKMLNFSVGKQGTDLLWELSSVALVNKSTDRDVCEGDVTLVKPS